MVYALTQMPEVSENDLAAPEFPQLPRHFWKCLISSIPAMQKLHYFPYH